MPGPPVQLWFIEIVRAFSFDSLLLALNGSVDKDFAREVEIMSRRLSDKEYRVTQSVISTVYLLLIGLLAVASARAEDTGESELRSSTTTHIVRGGRESGDRSGATRDSFGALDTSGERVRPGTASDDSNADTPKTARATSNDFWIYDADVVLFGDDDRDGFFYGVDLLFDADTVWTEAWVYAVVYLSLEGGPWNEYASSDDFLIAGASSDDEYVLVTELETGYPTGGYDILIELYDADTGAFLADYGPELNSDLALLPLEDFDRDAPIVAAPPVVVKRGGGGSTGIVLLGLLALTLALRRRDVITAPVRS